MVKARYENFNLANYLYFLNALHEHFKTAEIDKIENGYTIGSVDVENVFDMFIAPEVRYVDVEQHFYCECEEPSATKFYLCCQEGDYHVNLLHCCDRTILERE